MRKLKILFGDSRLLGRIGFVLAALVLFRFLSTIPIPGIEAARLAQFLAGNQFLGILNIFSAGGLSNLSIVMLGVGPYITGSIIMQLMTIMVPRLKALYHEEGEAGRRKFTLYSRLLTVPLALIQGYALLTILVRQGVMAPLAFPALATNLIILAAGAVLMMWIGELISEYGIGNGVSIIIFAGIVATLPTQIAQLAFTFDPSMLPVYIGFVVAAIAIIWGVILVTEAERPIPVTYAKQMHGANARGGASTYLPLRLNQAGVMPIIFALSILLFPQVAANLLSGSESAIAQGLARFFTMIVETQWIYGILYFAFVFLFTYFYTAITFDPEALSQNLQKGGAFIPGIRPGTSTAQYISRVLGNVTFAGAFFLGIIAILPLIFQAVTGISTLALGGTALLIVVSVVLDLIKKMDAQLSMREY